MRAVIQRVSQASVAIAERVTGAIQTGLLVLAAFEENDSHEDLEWLSGKIVRLRIFNDSKGLMNCSVQDVQGGVLVVSQFTLFASTRKGNRPDFIRAAPSETATSLYQQFVRRLTDDLGNPVQTGEFGADMQVSLVNDGPVTLFIDTKERE